LEHPGAFDNRNLETRWWEPPEKTREWRGTGIQADEKEEEVGGRKLG